MEAIVLAGGRGGRLGRLTDIVPKSMLSFNNRPFLEYILDYWIARDVNKFILAVGYKYKVIQNHFGANYKKARIIYSIEDKPLGCMGAIELAIKHLNGNGTFLVMNGDTLLLGDSYIDIGTPGEYKRGQDLLRK